MKFLFQMLIDGRKQQTYIVSIDLGGFFFPAEAQYVQDALYVRSGAPHPTVKFVQFFLRDLQSKTMSCHPGNDCYHLGGISWIYPTPSNSHHRDNSTFSRESLNLHLPLLLSWR